MKPLATFVLVSSVLLTACGEEKSEAVDVIDDPTDTDCQPLMFYVDIDADGYGDSTAWVEACEQPEGTVLNNADCDDTNALVNPDAAEICNGLDDDCNSVIDDGVGEIWYADSDEDGYGNPNARQQACEQPEGTVDNDADCKDWDATVNPEAMEVCDEIDNNCDGQIDEGVATLWYADNDFDFYGDTNDAVESCEPVAGRVTVGGDCNDGSASVYPGAPDGCNATDDDCDGDIDEDVKSGWSLMTVDTNAMRVYEIDLGNASYTEVATIQADMTGINSMDVWEDGTAIVHSNAGSVLYSFDVCQGTGAELGATGSSAMGGISFGGGNQLYGINSGSDQFMQLNLNGNPGSVIGPLGSDIGNNGMAYDCSTDTLYGADANLDRIFTIDPVTGQASNFVSTSVPFQGVGLEFDHATGLLIAATGPQLWTIDPSTGSSTYIGSFNGIMVDDLAFHPVCP